MIANLRTPIAWNGSYPRFELGNRAACPALVSHFSSTLRSLVAVRGTGAQVVCTVKTLSLENCSHVDCEVCTMKGPSP